MNNFKVIISILFLLFTITGIQSNTQSNTPMTVKPKYSIPEFNQLEYSINREIEYQKQLDSIEKIK